MASAKPNRGPVLCHASRKPKIRYRDRVAALLALAKIAQQDKPGRPRQEKRPYRCPSCRGYHLTSEQRPSSKTKPA